MTPAANHLGQRAAQVRDLIAGDHLEETKKRLLDLATDFSGRDRRNQAIVISAELSAIERKEQLGTIDYDTASAHRNRVLYRVLELVDSIEEEPDLKERHLEGGRLDGPASHETASEPAEVERAARAETATLEERASELEKALRGRDLYALAQLTDFADRFAANRDLHHQAILLSQVIRRPGMGADAGLLEPRATEIIRRIVEEYRREDTRASLEKRQRRLAIARREAESIVRPRDVVFSAKGLGKSYRRTDFTLHAMDLELRLGEITGLVGRNANGKTTLLRLIAGELRHDFGEIVYPALEKKRRRKINWGRVKEKIAYLPQELPEWTGGLQSNLHFEAAMHGIRGRENEREVAFIVERLGLRDQLGKRWQELSGGTKVRFALARALVWRPELLILDEPLANLDIEAQQILLKDLIDLTASLRFPMSVVISSQHLHEVEAIADRILFLEAGELIFNGPRSEIGLGRVENIFELTVDCELEHLRRILPRESVLHLHHSGISFVLHATLEFTAADLLDVLRDEELHVSYFRDASRSTKVLFESTRRSLRRG